MHYVQLDYFFDQTNKKNVLNVDLKKKHKSTEENVVWLNRKTFYLSHYLAVTSFRNL